MHLPLSPFRGAALFAHCFTCSKDITAVKRIADSLILSGLAQSKGDFVMNSFHTNLGDLRAAAVFMASQSFGLHNLAPPLR